MKEAIEQDNFVAGGHVTEELDNDYYSGIVELETIRIAFVAAISRDLKVMAVDVTSTYIQACTEKGIYYY